MFHRLFQLNHAPDFDALNIDDIKPVVQNAIKDAKESIAHIKTQPEITWLNTVEPLTDITERVGRIWGVVSHLNAVVDTPKLRAIYNELMPDEVLAMDWDTVTSMDIILGGKTYTLAHEEVPDPNGCATGSYIWKYNGKEVDGDTVGTKLNTMGTSGYATGLTVEQAEELRFVFHRNESHHDKVELVFYPYNSSTCLVTLDGVPTVLADRSNVTSLITTINKFIAE